jgi:hypothetical protein
LEDHILAKDGKFSEIHIHVIDAGETYIKAYCYSRQQVRTFSLDRIFASQRIKTA